MTSFIPCSCWLNKHCFLPKLQKLYWTWTENKWAKYDFYPRVLFTLEKSNLNTNNMFTAEPMLWARVLAKHMAKVWFYVSKDEDITQVGLIWGLSLGIWKYLVTKETGIEIDYLPAFWKIWQGTLARQIQWEPVLLGGKKAAAGKRRVKERLHISSSVTDFQPLSEQPGYTVYFN